jgi:tetratricopeptide (TPR) repeat protein
MAIHKLHKKMKITILTFLLFYFPNLSAQDLKNTEWTQVKVERKDGSKIVDHLGTGMSITKYYVRESTVLLSVNNLFSAELPYTINNKVLSIGEFSKYKIDTADSEILVLTQISNKELMDDKVNRYIFLNRHLLFDYLKENDRIEIIGDSLIEYNNQFSPTYYGNIDKLFMTEFDPQKENKRIYGIYILDSKGKIENIQFKENKNFTKKEITKLTEILNRTNGFWILPETFKPYKYKINFGIDFTYFEPLSGIAFYYLSNVSTQGFTKSISLSEGEELNNYFNKGNDLIKQEKYEKASKQFIKCIEIESLYFDAYYNLAFCYQKLGNKNLACEIWNKLKIMGQKQGEYLFSENCR